MLDDFSHIKRLSRKYRIPTEDILLIGINLSGINADISDNRTRFKFRFKSSKETFYLAVCINTRGTPFSLKNNRIYFNKELIGTAIDREKDTCDSTYFRRNRTALTLNSNSRSMCRGCKFCGTYNQAAEDRYNLVTKNRLYDYIKNLLKENNLNDLSNIVDVGICTGCFKNEKKALEHILMVREVLRVFRFDNNLKYLGSQIVSEKSLDILKERARPFSLYFTLECFDRREKLLNYYKAKITSSFAEEILKKAKTKKINTTILYILGLDPLRVVLSGFRKVAPHFTEFPIINLYQNYIKSHELLRLRESRNIEYYLRARKEIESLFKGTKLRPSLWENYRGLWYSTFNGERLKGPKI